jgi:3-oxoacyl-[acyl-carrier-protein] synthase-1
MLPAMKKNRVYVNAYASLSCAGDTAQLMDAVYAKRTGVREDRTYMPDTSVALGSFSPHEFFASLEEVCADVLTQSNLESFGETLLIVGSSVGGIAQSEKIYFKERSYRNIDPSEHAISVISDRLDARYRFKDTRSVSTACTSSANALMIAQRLIELGAYDAVLVVGADALCYTTVCGFHALGVLSESPCTPFQKERAGMNVSEGIAALLLQNRKTDASVELCGSAGSSDAFHITNPDPEAHGAIACMEGALKDAGVAAETVDYVNAHGTGTQANDAVEALAVERVFAHRPYLSSTKAITGHTLGAAGALEAVVSCEVIKRGKIPPQTALSEPENDNVNLPRECVEMPVRYVMSNSFAFGGNNTALVFGAVQ